jgi:purine-binding chemotaxis protein CheW
MPWLIIKLKGQAFALPTQEVRELVMKPLISEVPETAAYVRGVMNIRGQTFPVIDLRKRLGLTSAVEESEAFCALMEKRREDHVNWLTELEASNRDHREFKLATDPHQCAFGRWYDSYKPENVWVGALLKRFAAPHERIHATAGGVRTLQSKADWEGAGAAIERARRGELSTMIALFNNLQELVRETRQEIVVVLQSEDGTLAVAVDEAVAVEKFEREKVGPLPMNCADAVIAQCGRRGENEPMVLMVATERLLEADVRVEGSSPDQP